MTLESLVQIPQLLLGNLVQLVMFGLVLTGLQALVPARIEQSQWDRSCWLDVGYSFLLTLCVPLFYIVPIALVELFVRQVSVIVEWRWQFSAGWPLILQVLVAILLIDIVSYWRHRLMHSRWLWPVHTIHHSSYRLNWLSTERFHVLNFLIASAIDVFFAQLLFSPVVIMIASFVRRFYNFFIHSNVKLDYGPLGYILVSPRFHHWHHNKDLAAAHRNYSTFFALTDWAFGTFYLPRDGTYPEQYGVQESLKEAFVPQLIYPFRAWYGIGAKESGSR